MKTKTYNVYKFDELSKEAQQKAIESLCDINVDHEWWEFTYEDAKNIGLEITGFDIGRGAYCEGDFIEAPLTVIKLIKENHGEECETYKTALQYEKEMSACPKDGDGEPIENEMEVIEDDFRNSLLEDYRIMLGREFEYLTSKEAIIETIKANDYDFTDKGGNWDN